MRERSNSEVNSVVPARDSEVDSEPEVICRIGLVHGLVQRADLNGRLARAVRWVPSKARWALLMDGGEKVLIKDDNVNFQDNDQAARDARWLRVWQHMARQAKASRRPSHGSSTGSKKSNSRR